MTSNQPYIVSARKYRPATFRTVVGQRALTATLKNAITSGKLAQAYLFCGPRGVGKTSCARIFAKTINCLNPTPEGEACGECESCRAIDRGNSFNLVELDAASNNSVDNIRNITEQVNIPAQNGRYRVFIIDEVHMLSNTAFNAFLKTLEEPPKNVVFILATTERHKVIPTILSRCQVYDFRRITINDIIDHLEFIANSEGVNAEREALGVIALKADGAMRDALSIFDQVVASTHGEVTYQGTIDALNVLDQDYYFRLVDTFVKGDVAEALLTFKEITDKGFDAHFFINGLAEHIRNLMVSADTRTFKLLETSKEQEKKFAEQAPKLPLEWYYTAIRILNDTDFNYKTSGNKRLLVELALIRLSRLLGGGSNRPFQGPDGEKPQPAPAVSKEAERSVATPDPPSPQKVSTSSKSVVSGYSPTISPASTSRKEDKNRPTSFRLSTESTVKSQTAAEPQNQSFSEAQLHKAWEEYIDAHPDQRILTAAMRGALPQKVSDTSYSVTVDHPAQLQAFEAALPQLLDFLKRELSNDFVSLNILMNESEAKNDNLNPKEFLKKTIEDNPVLAKFLKDIDAELEIS